MLMTKMGVTPLNVLPSDPVRAGGQAGTTVVTGKRKKGKKVEVFF